MKHNKPIFILFLLLPCVVSAEVFKCKSTAGEMIYQPSPCTAEEIPIGKLNIKEMTPEEAQKADALRKEEEAEEVTYEAEKAKAEKERQAELYRQQQLSLEARRTKAQEDEANAVRNRMWRPPQPIFR